MFAPELNYFSTFHCKCNHLSRNGTSFWMSSSTKVAAKPFAVLHNFFGFSVTPQNLAGQTFLHVEKQVVNLYTK